MKNTLLLTILTFHAFSSAIHEDLKKEITPLLKRKYTVDDIAVLTFKPPHEEMSCMQSSLVSGIKIWYDLQPLRPYVISSLTVGIIGATGPAGLLAIPLGFIVGLPALLFSDCYSMDECAEQAKRYSNTAARRYLPNEYSQHVTTCKRITGDLETEWKKREAFIQFKEQERKQSEETSRQRFEEQYQKEQQ